MTMASAARCVPALALHDARARRASANATRAMVPKTQAFSTGRRASDPEGFLAGDARVGVDASEARSRRASRRTTEAVPSPFPRRARSARHAASRPGRHLRHLRIEANNIPSLRHLDCRVPSVTASASRRAATRDARNARDLAFAASPRRRPGEARAVALAGAPGDPPAAVAGGTAHTTTEHVARTPVQLPRSRSSQEPRRGQSGFSEISQIFLETRAPSRVARGRAAVSFSVSTLTVRCD